MWRSTRSWLTTRWWAVPGAAVAAATRIPNLARPGVFVFDEIFYANDALDLATHGVEMGAAWHPSAGKWLIAFGELAFGFDPVGWRVAALVAGIVTVVASAALTHALTRSGPASAAAGLLVAFDGVAFTTGRLALLDGFAAMWGTVGMWALVRAARTTPVPPVFAWCAVIALSLATATKWSTAPLLVGAAVYLVVCQQRRVARAGAYAAAAAGVYLVVHAGWFVAGSPPACDANGCSRERGVAGTVAFAEHQVDMVDFHVNLDRVNLQLEPAWRWPFDSRSTVLFERDCVDGSARSDLDRVCGDIGGSRRVVARPNPVVWLAGLTALAAVGVGSARGRRDTPALLVTGAALVMWLPWVPANAYTFYAAPVVPFLAATAAAQASRSRSATTVTAAVVAGAGAWFAVAFASLNAS